MSKRYQSNKPRVVVAMSGGVDSSVAAAMLKKEGYDVIGIFLKFWSPLGQTRTDTNRMNTNGHENICCSREAADSARSVAKKLDIPFYVFDASKEFKKKVVDYYIEEYDCGRTPNPCIVCNKFIKFGWLLKKAKELNADYLATGHYARIKCSFHSQFLLYKAKDNKKDQSYFLWQLSQDQLKHILFPLGGYTKPEVRKLAREFGLPTAEKKESQNICFIPNGNNYDFLSQYAGKLNQPGNIIDINGNILGVHKGLAYYTIGQRHGLEGIQQKVQRSKTKAQGSGFRPVYVIRLNITKNELVVGEEKDLYQKDLIAQNVNWIDSCNIKHVNSNKKFICKAKIRYGHQANNCYIVASPNCSNEIKVIFNKPQRAITSGQSIVFYRKDEVIGGGIIK